MSEAHHIENTLWREGSTPDPRWDRMFTSLVVAFRYAEGLPTDDEKDEMIAEIEEYASQDASMPPQVTDMICKFSSLPPKEDQQNG